MTILYGVSFPEPISSLPREISKAKGIPGNDGWAAWEGWSIEVKGSRVLIKRPAIDITSEVRGYIPAAKDEHEANSDDRNMLLVDSVPVSMCILHYLEGQTRDKASGERSPTPALLKLLEKRAATPEPPSRPPGVPLSAYAGPPLTPMRQMAPQVGPRPPGPVRPEAPPPSIIVDEPEVVP